MPLTLMVSTRQVRLEVHNLANLEALLNILSNGGMYVGIFVGSILS